MLLFASPLGIGLREAKVGILEVGPLHDLLRKGFELTLLGMKTC